MFNPEGTKSGAGTPEQLSQSQFIERELRREIFGGEGEELLRNADPAKLSLYHERLAAYHKWVSDNKDEMDITTLHHRTQDWANRFIRGEEK